MQKGSVVNPSQNPGAIRSKKEITDTLLQLMESHPYNEITVKQIIPEAHVALDSCPIFQSLSPEQVSYVIACNVGAVWNVIMKRLEYDRKDAPENIKNAILQYLNRLSLASVI